MSNFYVTSFCNFAHRLTDGKPVAHNCYILPPAALEAERAGDIAKAQAILAEQGKGREMRRGVSAKREPYDTNRATLPRESVSNIRRQKDRELNQVWSVVAVRRGEFSEPVTVTVHYGRSRNAHTAHACIWVRCADGRRYFSGEGSAGGYGYHRNSAAIGSAIEAAGIKLRGRIDGCGDGPVKHALEAIARAAGYRRFTILQH